jgi:hypothetical protein
MRTTTIESVLLRAWQRAGNDGSTISAVPATSLSMLVASANQRVQQCWEWADWPELCRVEERTVQGDSTSGMYLDYAQAGEEPMGEIFAVYLDNPATHVSPREIGYSPLGDAIRFSGTVPAEVWVKFRLRPTVYSTGTLSAPVPAVFATAMGYLLSSDLLEEDGQFDKALLLEQKAEAELVAKRDQYLFQQQQTLRWTVAAPY